MGGKQLDMQSASPTPTQTSARSGHVDTLLLGPFRNEPPPTEASPAPPDLALPWASHDLQSQPLLWPASCIPGPEGSWGAQSWIPGPEGSWRAQQTPLGRGGELPSPGPWTRLAQHSPSHQNSPGSSDSQPCLRALRYSGGNPNHRVSVVGGGGRGACLKDMSSLGSDRYWSKANLLRNKKIK